MIFTQCGLLEKFPVEAGSKNPELSHDSLSTWYVVMYCAMQYHHCPHNVTEVIGSVRSVALSMIISG